MITYINTSAATLTLDFQREDYGNFVGVAAITGAKTIAIANDNAAEVFALTLNVTTGAVLTMPTKFVMETTDSRFVADVLTLTGTGKYAIVGLWDGANWQVKATANGGLA